MAGSTRANEGAGPERYDAAPYVPEGADLAALRGAAAGCEGCPLFRDTTGTVFGAGNATARVLLVGEEPGDQEDRRGEPFVGPAGRLLTRARTATRCTRAWSPICGWRPRR
ncbi:hypothetical protein D7319_25600 [Streptomyces radicis]|uniref:Uracil-DNA glycosylase-like domain-containing protein n=1 Tax=Streptomyces radicis TaxID=1750517 RepID=A0A3A9VXE3_9ACTN|nr:hypothetical protein D7319_25600 [Streptomyces radicis]RKN16898.1 hypothetical protein D7318_24965 [Streptomyces radicis]